MPLGLANPARSGLGLADPIERAAAIKASVTQPRGLRNNNPLNIEAGDFTQGLPGFAGSDGRFARFENVEQGINAADRLLQSYARRGLNTVEGVIGRWAPASDNNDVGAYAQFVSEKLGVNPDQPLDMGDPSIRGGLINAMGEFENGQPINEGETMPINTGANIDDIRSRLEGGDSGIPQISENPVEAIGLVMQEVGNALEGRGSVIDKLQQRQLQRRALDLKMADGFLNLIGKAQEVAKTVPEGKQEEAFGILNQIAGNVMPGLDITEFVGEGSSVDIEKVVPRFEQMSDESRALVVNRVKALGGDSDALKTVLQDEDFMETIQSVEDEKNRSSIADKSDAMLGILSERGVKVDDVPELSFQDFTAINEKAPEGVRLTPSEMRTLKANPDIARGFDIQSEEAASAAEKKRAESATDKPKSDLIDETGAVKNEVTNTIRGIVANIFGGSFNPLTGEIQGVPGDKSALQMTAIVAEAENLLKSGEADSVGEAVQIAAKNFGKQVQQPNGQAGPPQTNGGAQEFSSAEEVERAVEAGEVNIGDTVIINGQRMKVGR